jgi:hypothetical protein
VGTGTLACPAERSSAQEASAAGLAVKIYGEAVENDTFLQPNGSTSEPAWSDFYADSQCFEGGPGCAAPGTQGETTLYFQHPVLAYSSVPAVSNHLIKNFPQFDLGIPDQFPSTCALTRRTSAARATGDARLLCVLCGFVFLPHLGELLPPNPRANSLFCANLLGCTPFQKPVSHW